MIQFSCVDIESPECALRTVTSGFFLMTLHRAMELSTEDTKTPQDGGTVDAKHSTG